MKLLIAGKGGVGKTTVAALLSHILADNGYSVLALDTDSVPNLAQSLGLPLEVAEGIVPLAKNEELAEERTGARPGEGWGLLFSLTPKVDDIVDKFGVRVRDGLSLVVVGSIDAGKEGCLCPAIALAKAFLNHVLLKRREVIVVDAEAGAEVFGRGLAEKFDMTICVSEPTVKSLAISRKLIKMSRDLGVRRNVLVINKVVDNLRAAQLYAKMFSNDPVPYHIVRYDENLVSIEARGLGVTSLPKGSPVVSDVFSLYNKVLKLIKL